MRTDDVISYLPPWASTLGAERLDVTTFVPPDGQHPWVCHRPRLGEWRAAADGLRRAGRVLREQPVERIVAAIDRVAARWCDPTWPVRLAIRDKVAAATGFSPAAVDRSFDLELRNYRADSLWRVLRRELRDPACLDMPRKDLEVRGATMAIGPKLVLAIFTGNVPGLPALSMVRSLLVKAPVIAKVASGEPSFAAAFAASLGEEMPALGDAILVTYWGREEKEVFESVAREAEVVIAYGGEEACRAIRASLPSGVRLVEHGHKLSVGYVSARYAEERGVAEVAQAIARDVAAFNQQACIAPQAYFVEGSVDHARAFAANVGAALAEQARVSPVGVVHVADAARLRLERAQQAWRAAAGESRDVWHAGDLEWTVTLDETLAAPDGLGNRFLRVIPVTRLEAMLDQIRPFGSYLQNVGLGCVGDELGAATHALAELGASRVCEPGRMPEPSMMWRHDGRTCVAELVRWCDVEMHRGQLEV